ncbi:MAG: FAD-binding oxidoreductase [Chloroflexi bacterium]|nr:FAD-binding oxidoreductase [Chloroflexota bacterium]
MRYNVDLEALASIVGASNVSARPVDLEAHSIDESCVEPSLPDAIVWPANTQEIAAILRYAYENEIPVVPWSGGSSLEGNPVPVCGGIILAMYRLKEIIEVNEDDLQATVQPGIVYDDLNAHLRRLGLFFPPAPGSADVATLGGMVSNNSSGMHAVKYGVTRNYVMKLKVVLPDGRIMDVGSRAKKSTSGYDLVGLFIGSEGTLGVITEITLRLMGLPEQVSSAVAVFETLNDATAAVYDAVRYGLDVAAIELLDSGTVRVTNEQQGLSLRETPTLFIEFHGPKLGVEDQAAYMREICTDNHCASFELADTPEQRAVLWAARREARNSIKLSHAGEILISGDVCLPISHFGEMVEYAHQVARETGLRIYVFGHAGDGNLHTETIIARDDAEMARLGSHATDLIVRRALALGGTIAGEHGVGLAKKIYLEEEHGPAVEMMRAIKSVFDPRGIMNPGKIFA